MDQNHRDRKVQELSKYLLIEIVVVLLAIFGVAAAGWLLLTYFQTMELGRLFLFFIVAGLVAVDVFLVRPYDD